MELSRAGGELNYWQRSLRASFRPSWAPRGRESLGRVTGGGRGGGHQRVLSPSFFPLFSRRRGLSFFYSCVLGADGGSGGVGGFGRRPLNRPPPHEPSRAR